MAAGVAIGVGLARLLPGSQAPVPLKRAPKRCAGMCKLKKEMYDQYTQLHDHTWDEVMERVRAHDARRGPPRLVSHHSAPVPH